MKIAARHLIQCHCILPQYRKRTNPVFHKFVVFSIIDNDKVEEKIAQCPNCNVVLCITHRVFALIHNIVDLCKSEIVEGKDETSSIVGIDDLKISLPEKLINILESYSVDLPTWEHASFILEEKMWNERIKLASDETNEKSISKFLLFLAADSFKIITESSQLFLEEI